MAGHAGDRAQVAQAAVDAGDHAQRQVQFVQHRALFDVHLDKAQVTRRVALQRGDGLQRGRQAGGLHGLAHGHAVGILLVQPAGVEVAGECAAAQEGGLVALAFFFGEAHHLDAKRQPTALGAQLAHQRHRHQDAQAAVVLAGVAHGVVVAAGEQAFCVRRRAVIDAHHVAHGVDRHLVEAGLLHPPLQAARHGLVRLGQVGDGQLPLLLEAGVAVHGQFFGPVPDLLAARGVLAELVVQAQFGHAVDVAQRLGEFEVGVVRQAALERGDDLAPVQPRAARAAHGQHEGPAELGVVGGVELLQVRKLFGRAIGQARLALFIRAFGGEVLADHGLAGQFGVGADQLQLRVVAGAPHAVHQRQLQRRQALERPLRGRGLCHPW